MPKKDADMDDGKAKPVPEATVQEYETKIKKKSVTTSIAFDFSFFGWLPDALKKFKEVEDEMTKQDRQFLDLKESKNQLETCCYKYRDNF